MYYTRSIGGGIALPVSGGRGTTSALGPVRSCLATARTLACGAAWVPSIHAGPAVPCPLSGRRRLGPWKFSSLLAGPHLGAEQAQDG